MNEYQDNLQEENLYLEETLALIHREIESQTKKFNNKKNELLALKREMMQDTGGTGVYQGVAENSQYLTEVNSSTAIYNHINMQIRKHKSLINSPYFGRIDFLEEGEDKAEKLYIGLATLIDSESNDIYIYDWRAPISSIYYQYGRGEAEYLSPMGKIKGLVSLKRQYKIKDSKLLYFFDCNVTINDKLLQEMLSQSKSGKMKNIVESIQKEQDEVIRDTEHDLLIVQGVAGSGKTSIALHRIAYLLYAGLNSSLNSSNIIIISPNDVFSEYISNILPELGEDSVIQVTFYELAQRILKESFALEQRESQLEFLIDFRNTDFGIRRKENVDFKGSISFVRILDRLIDHFGRQAIAFEDISYDGKIVMTRQQLKNRFLNNKFNIPMVKQLQRLEKTVLDKIQPLKKNRFKKIRDIVDNSEGRDFEEESFSRLLMIKYSRSLARQLRKLSRIDFIEVYRLLFEDRELIGRLSKGLELPEKIDLIARDTLDSLNQGRVQYEDIGPLLYLKLKIEGEAYYPEIKQVVIDETQDYYPIQFEVFNLLFKESKYTLLGDIYQSVEKDESYSFYDHIASIFSRERTAKLFIKKSYRSSYEISKFNQRLLGKRHLTFMRHGQEPQIIRCKNEEAITLSIAKDIGDFLAEGGKSLAVICKTQKEADKVYLSLKSKKVQVGLGSNVLDSKAVVIPGYNAKGLEFDTVIVYNGNRSDYTDIFDKKLLYVACTRALHNLRIYYTGEKSHFLAFCPSLQRK